MNKKEKKALYNSLILPILFLAIMWIVKIIEYSFDFSFVSFGVYPKNLAGIRGILLSPFIHKDFSHLLNNSYPVLILGGILFAFYKKIAIQLFLWQFFISGFWLWIIGRPSFHIGASGIIYAMASFLFISGVIRKNPRLSAISMLVIFLYGSMIWGVLPTNQPISWEGHLSGFIAGIIVAIFYRKEGPKRKRYQWEIDEELEEKEKLDVIAEKKNKFRYILKKYNKHN
tara:strand:- start:249 stop:932 length:684 start_codon:yes stop_codon:yes gene_type:complete